MGDENEVVAAPTLGSMCGIFTHVPPAVVLNDQLALATLLLCELVLVRLVCLKWQLQFPTPRHFAPLCFAYVALLIHGLFDELLNVVRVQAGVLGPPL